MLHLMLLTHIQQPKDSDDSDGCDDDCGCKELLTQNGCEKNNIILAYNKPVFANNT
jgi:hypothetical protein